MKDKVMEVMAQHWIYCLPMGEHVMGYDGCAKVRDSFNKMYDEKYGGHMVWDEATAKASFDFSVKIFGEYQDKMSLGQMFAQIDAYMKHVFPLIKM